MTTQLVRELTRRDRRALRALLVASTAVAGRADLSIDLDTLAEAAPIDLLPYVAGLHRVSGSVATGLTGARTVPDSVTQSLLAARRQSTAHHLRITRALSAIADAWDQEGIPWVVMKGPAVATLLYREVGDRAYADLDLLVPAESLPQATDVLAKLGYQHSIKDWALAEQMGAGEFTMSSPIIDVDLHWQLLYSEADRRPFSFDPEAMIGRSRSVGISGCTARTFDEVDTLLTLAFHAARSGGHRLIWLKDIERSFAMENPDPDEIVRRARRYKCAAAVGVMLHRSRSILHARIPDELITSLTTRPLRAGERLTTAVVSPVQFDERDTCTRVFTRSVKSSVASSLGEVPPRARRWVGDRLRAPADNETDDLTERVSYFRSILIEKDKA